MRAQRSDDERRSFNTGSADGGDRDVSRRAHPRVFSPLLQGAKRRRRSAGGGVWRPNGRGTPACLFAAGSGYEPRPAIVTIRVAGMRSAARACSRRSGGSIPLGGGAGTSRRPDGGAEAAGTLVHWPFDVGHGPRLLELLFDASADEARQREVLRFLQQAEPEWNGTEAPQGIVRAARAGDGDWDGFLLRLHRSLNIDEIGYTIANDGRRLIGADRVCVLVQEGARLRLASVSGVDLPDRRSNVTRTVEAAAAAVMRSGRQLVYSAESGDPLPPQLDRPLNAYADANHVRAAIFAPLPSGDGESTEERPGALLAEWFVHVRLRLRGASRLAGHAGPRCTTARGTRKSLKSAAARPVNAGLWRRPASGRWEWPSRWLSCGGAGARAGAAGGHGAGTTATG